MIKNGSIVRIISMTSIFFNAYGIVIDMYIELYRVRISFPLINERHTPVIIHMEHWFYFKKIEEVI